MCAANSAGATAAPASSEMRMPFPGASGRGLKIAVIDSGVNARHPHITAPVRGVVFGEEEGDPAWDDPIGHGTAVTAAIQEKAPDAEYYALKIFGPSLRAVGSRLLEALEWAIGHQMDIVNLSLGTPNLEQRHAFRALVDRARQVGTVLVAARRACEIPVLPGALEGVIGVEVDWDLPRHRYRIHGKNGSERFFASGYPRPLPGISPARNLNGVSFAVANMSGLVARAAETLGGRSLEEIRAALATEEHRT